MTKSNVKCLPLLSAMKNMFLPWNLAILNQILKILSGSSHDRKWDIACVVCNTNKGPCVNRLIKIMSLILRQILSPMLVLNKSFHVCLQFNTRTIIKQMKQFLAQCYKIHMSISRNLASFFFDWISHMNNFKWDFSYFINDPIFFINIPYQLPLDVWNFCLPEKI